MKSFQNNVKVEYENSVEDENNEEKEYSDKDIQVATQIAYMDIPEGVVQEYRDFTNDQDAYPTLEWVLTKSKDCRTIKENYLDRFKIVEGDQGSIDNSKKAQELLTSITFGESKYADWKVSLVHDDNKNSGMYGLMLETDNNNALVAFRGSEGEVEGQFEKDWINADFGLFDSVCTKQQAEVEVFMQEIKSHEKSFGYYVTAGHSLGGNLSEHFVIIADGEFGKKVVKGYSLDGPGYSTEYINDHLDLIMRNAGKVTRYQWSPIGVLLQNVPNENYCSVKALGPEEYGGKYKYMFFKHDTMMLCYDENGNFISCPMGNFEKSLSDFSKTLDKYSIDNEGVFIEVYQKFKNLSEKDFAEFGSDMLDGNFAYYSFLTEGGSFFRGGLLFGTARLVFGIGLATFIAADNLFNDGMLTRDYVIPGFIKLCEFGTIAENEIKEFIEYYKENGFETFVQDWLDGWGEIWADAWGEICDWFRIDLNKLWGEAASAAVRTDPLILDIDGDGFNIASKKYGAHFDLNSDGFAEKINWTNKDAILALDINGNGKIDNGREVFGDFHLLADGTNAKNGFEALAQYDTNEDGIIDEEDEIFGKLRLWTDSNSDGESSPAELKKLSDFGIKAIKLNYEVANQSTGTEALIGNIATFEYEDGKEGSIGEMWVASDLYDTIGTVISNISEEVNGLPDVRSYGKLNSLHTEISLDETGTLQSLTEQFVEETDNDARLAIVDRILNFMCKTEEIEDGSRGGLFSAKKLKVLETIMGESFMGVNGENPNSAAAPILENVYKQIVEMYCFAMVGSKISKYLDYIVMNVDEAGKPHFNTAFFNLYVDTLLKSDLMTKREFADISSYLGYFATNVQNSYDIFQQFREFFSTYDSEWLPIIDDSVFGAIRGDENGNSLNGTVAADLIFGKEGNDSISSGRGNDLIYGGADNDTIHGDEGDDIIYGDEGDDYLDGGSGNDILIDSEGDDTFVFGRGYGHDEIRDEGGKNSIRFAGLSPRDISVNGIDDFDVRITIKSTGETLTIKNFRKDETLADYTLIFDNVTMHCTDEKSPFRHIYGGDGDDVLKAAVPDSTMHSFGGDDTVIGSKGNDVIYSGTGKDTIEAGAGDDIVYGEIGDDSIRGEVGRDVIYGGSGDDTISGGADDDVLIGGEGKDTYIFGRGFGIDVIDDIEGESVIRLESGISEDDINVYISGSEAVIAIKNALGDDTESAVSTDRLVIKDYVGNEDKYSVVIAGETKSLRNMIIIPDAEEAAAVEDTSLITGTDDYNYVVSGEEAETILGDGHLDRILASFGDDTLFGGDGNDQLFGEEGRDFIFGNEGDEYINGGLDNDVISGGAGKDFIDGGEGDDVYIYNLGDGTDSIKDSEGLNRIVFGEGINPSTIKCYRSNWNDLMVTFDGTADNIIIKNYCISKEARNFELVFADGTVLDATDAESPLRTIYGTNGSEYMATIYEDGITMIGQDGYDEVHGGAGNDNLHGGAGDDRVIGEAGNDTLFGEAGRDYLAGGAGDDTYIYRAGDGIDTVSDSEGTNYISIEGYSIGDVKAYRTNWNNLTIVFGDGNVNSDYRADGTMQDKLVIENFFVSDNSRNYYISYNGSGMIHAAASNSPLRTIYSTNGNEYMLAMDDNGVTLIASDGYNTINGGAGSDRLYGGTGNDSILGNAGNDYIDGKTGNDTLLGGAGNDTYIFDAGYGTDRIVEDTGLNTIQFGAGIDKDSITAERSENNDLKLVFGDTDDRLILTGYFADEERRKYDVSFANGERFGFEDEENPISVAYEDTVALELQNQIDEFENAFESEESAPIAEETDLQTMKLVEDMAGFGAEGEVSEGVSFTDDTTTLLSDQIIITDSEI